MDKSSHTVKTTMTSAGDRTDNRRARILAVARKHFGRHGFRRTVLDEIAADAGCAKGSLYLEFANKQALYHAVLDDVHAEVGQRFAAVVGGIESPAEWLRASLRFTFTTLEREPLLARLLTDDPELPALREYAARDQVRAAAEAALTQFRGLLRRGVEAGELRRDLDLEVVPFVLAGLKFLHMHADLITAGLIDRGRYFDGLADFALAAVLAPKESAE
jgi:AcrR family transcriptional regulator